MISTRLTQQQRIIDYILQQGSITCLDAVYKLGILDMQARICELKKKGYRFKKKQKAGIAKLGYKFKYVEYSLED